jgi:predicted dehydrogenase
MKNIAIIGLGKWGKNLLREFSKISNVSVCVTTGKTKNLNWLRKNYPKLQHTTKLVDILDDKTIGAVVIATPIKTHANLTTRILKTGKHVFVEKPLSTELMQSKKIIEFGQKNKLVVFVGYIFSYHQIFQKIKSIAKRENIIYAQFDWSKNGAFDENIILNLLSHDIFLALELFGKPSGYSILDKIGFTTNLDILTIELQFPKNKRCMMKLNRISNYKKKLITIITTKNLYQWDDNVLYKFDKSKRMFKKIYDSTTPPLESECNMFIKEITKKHIDYNQTNVLNAAEIMDKIIKQI